MKSKSAFLRGVVLAGLVVLATLSCSLDGGGYNPNSSLPLADSDVPAANLDPALDSIVLDIDTLKDTPLRSVVTGSPKDLVILMYHHIVTGKAANEYQRSVTDFENDLVFLRNNDIRVVTLDDMIAMQNGTIPVPPERLAVITFDDGYLTAYSNAFPILKKYDMKATLFVITGLVGSDSTFYLDWPTLRTMAAYRNGSGERLVSVNAHTVTHPFLEQSASRFGTRAEYLAFLQTELGQSKAAIEREIPATDRGLMFMSLPYGDGVWNADIINTAKALGYSGIRTSEAFAYDIFSGGNYAMPSVPVYSWTAISGLPSYYTNWTPGSTTTSTSTSTTTTTSTSSTTSTTSTTVPTSTTSSTSTTSTTVPPATTTTSSTTTSVPPPGTAASPVFTPPGGAYASAQSVSMTSATSGVTIRYTTNGSTPTTRSSVYRRPVQVSSTMTLKAIAIKKGMTTSAVSTAVYTIGSATTTTTVPVTTTTTVPSTTTTSTSTTSTSSTTTTTVPGTGYTLTYHANGATSGTPPAAGVHPAGTVVTVAGAGTLARSGGYAFDGWNTFTDGFGTAYKTGSTLVMGSAPVNLYARWVIDPTYPDPAYLGNIPSLNYDGITPVPTTDPYVITPTTYQNHLSTIRRFGYSSMTLKAFVDAVDSPFFPADFPRRPVLLYSDVSSRDFMNYAEPILASNGFVATIGVETKLVVDEPHPSWAMTPADLLVLQGKGIEIASHSRTHPALTTVTDAKLVDEVANTKTVLSGYGLNVSNFIYPYGDYDARVIAAVKAAGYSAARATSGADFTSGGYASVNPDNRFSLGTACITQTATLDQLERYLTNPMLEVEDIYSVVRDAGSLGSVRKAGPPVAQAVPGIAPKISRTDTDFKKDSYGSIYMPDAGDEVSIPLVIFRSGTYSLKFRVKTGYRGADFASTGGYEYRLDGGPALGYTAEGPVVNEDQNITWGYHRLGTMTLQAGVRRVSIRTLVNWAVLVDGLVLEYVGP